MFTLLRKLPDNPNQRVLVGIFDEYAFDQFRRERGSMTTLQDRRFAPLSSTNYEPGNTIIDSLERNGLMRPNTLLVLSPYDDALYYPFETADNESMLAKCQLFADFVRHLGAKKVKIRESLIDQESALTEGSIQAGSSIARAGSSASLDRLEFQRIQTELAAEFEGGDPDLKQAASLLQQSRLNADHGLQRLFEMRSGGNLVRHWRMDLDLKQEISRRYALAFEVVVPKYFSLEAKFERKKEDNQSYSLAIEVTF